jgi:hypothetical protein
MAARRKKEERSDQCISFLTGTVSYHLISQNGLVTVISLAQSVVHAVDLEIVTKYELQ